MSTKIISAYFWLCNMYASFSIKGFGLLKMLINGWTKWLSGSAFGEKQTERWKSKTEGWLGRVSEWVSEREREREREKEQLLILCIILLNINHGHRWIVFVDMDISKAVNWIKMLSVLN